MTHLGNKANKTKNNFIRQNLFTLFILLNINVQAQSYKWLPPLERSASKKAMSLGLNMGILGGLGLDVAYRINPKLSAKVSMNVMNLAVNNFQYTLKGKINSPLGATPQTFLFNLDAQFSHLDVAMEYAIDYNGRFRLLSSLCYYPKNYLMVSGELTTIVRFNDLQLNSNDLGKGSIKMGFKSPISAYIGFGVGRLHASKMKRVNVSADFGAFYKGDYKFGIVVQQGGLIRKENENNAVVLDKNFNAHWNNKIWPNANIRIGYRLF